MINYIKRLLKSNYTVRKYIKGILDKYHTYNSDLTVINQGYGKILKCVKGGGNTIKICKNTFMDKSSFRIIGDNNTIEIGSNCSIGPQCSFWMEGNNIKITIGDNCSMTRLVHINAQEDNSEIHIGDDCMFSNKIIIRTSDSHPIFDINTNERTNPPANIIIGRHVWIAPSSTIMKGTIIGNGSIIGSNTIVCNKKIESNCLAVGAPAKIVKTNIKWTRDKLF